MNTRKLSNAIKGKLPERLQHISITRRSMLMLVTFSLLTGGLGFGVMASTPFDEINAISCNESNGVLKNAPECKDGQLVHEEDVPGADDVPENPTSPDVWPCQRLSDQWNRENSVITDARRANTVGTSRCDDDGTFCVVRNGVTSGVEIEQCIPNPVDPEGVLSTLSCQDEPMNLTVIASGDTDAALDEIGCVLEDQIAAFFADNIVGASKNINPAKDQSGAPIDRDGDDRLDAYVITHPDVTAQTGGGVYIQADFIHGPLSDLEPMVIDSTTGKNLTLKIRPMGAGGLVIDILGGGEPYLAITFDPSNSAEVLTFENFDSSSNKIPARKQNDTYVPWSAPTSLESINIVPGVDWDGDGYLNIEELESHPLNAASTPENVDGDLCSRADEGPEADNDPEVCRDQPWDILITAPDANTTDALGASVWANTTVDFNITLNPTRAALYGDNVPIIQNIYMYVSQAGTGAHKDNATAPGKGTQLTAYDGGCDTVKANKAGASDTEFDGDGFEHHECPIFAKGYFLPGKNGVADTFYTPHMLCAYNPDVPVAAQASLIQGLDPTTLSDLAETNETIDLSCPFDTTILDDGEDYHVYSHLCFVGENCARTLNLWHKADKTDLRDRTDLSDHFNIVNKPVFTLLNMTDADGSTDRDGYISDDAILDFYGLHPLGQALDTLEFDVSSHWQHPSGTPAFREGEESEIHYSFNFTGPFPRYEEIGLDAKLEQHPTLPNTYRVTMASSDWHFDLKMATQSPKGGVRVDDAKLFAVDRPANHIKSWNPGPDTNDFVAKDVVRFFNNRGPTVKDLGILSVERGLVTQPNATVNLTFHYADPDRAGAPDLAVTMTKLDDSGNYTDMTHTITDCVQRKASLTSDRDRGVEGNGALANVGMGGSGSVDDDIYDCMWTTPDHGTFAWNVAATDPDATNNTTEVRAPTNITLVNAPTLLRQGTVSVVGYNETGGTRQRVDVHVRYEDADDAPAIVLANITKDGALFRQAELRPYTPTEATEDLTADSACGPILNAGALASAAADDRHLRHYCGVLWLPDGDYNATFWAEALRDGAARFPADPSQAIPVDVGGAGVDCGYCGGFEDQSQGGADAYRTAVVAINAELEDRPLPGAVPDAMTDVRCSLITCSGIDDDGDGHSNQAEAGVSDPNNPYSTPVDRDADLVPNGPENVVDIDLWYVRADGVLQMKESGSVTLCGSVSTSTCGDGALTLEIRPEQGGLYNLSVDVGNVETSSSSVPYAEYTVLPTGIELQVIDPRTDAILLFLQVDAAKLASTGDAPVKLHFYGDKQNVLVNVTTAPVDVEYHSFNSNLRDGSAYQLVYTEPLPQVQREKSDGSWEHCVQGTCVDLVGLTRVGFRETENGGREVYVDPQDNGGETQVGGNNLLCYEDSLGAQLTASASDADCDGYTNIEELSSCSDPTSMEDTLIQGQPATPCGERGVSGTPNDCIEEPGRFHQNDVDCDDASNGEEIGSQLGNPGKGTNPLVSD